MGDRWFVRTLNGKSTCDCPVEYVAVRENNLRLLITHWSPFSLETDVTMSFVDLAIEKLDTTFE